MELDPCRQKASRWIHLVQEIKLECEAVSTQFEVNHHSTAELVKDRRSSPEFEGQARIFFVQTATGREAKQAIRGWSPQVEARITPGRRV